MMLVFLESGCCDWKSEFLQNKSIGETKLFIISNHKFMQQWKLWKNLEAALKQVSDIVFQVTDR